MKHNVLRFQVVMNDFLWQLMQIFDCIDNLFNHHFGFFLRQSFMFLQVIGQIRAFTVLKNCAESILINFYCSVQPHNVWMVQHFVNLFFPYCMLDEILFNFGVPLRTKFMKFNCHFNEIFSIKSFVHFTESTFSQQSEKLIFPNLWPNCCANFGVNFAILRVLFIIQQFILFDMQNFLLLQSFQSLLQMSLFSRQEMHL